MQVAKQISAENRDVAGFVTALYVPPQLDDKTPADLRDAHDYYLTPRAQHPRAEDKILVRSVAAGYEFWCILSGRSVLEAAYAADCGGQG